MPRTYRIRGAQDASRPAVALPIADTAAISVTHVGHLLPGTARDAAPNELDIPADTVVRVTLDNGFVLWSRADDLIREYGRKALARDGGEGWEFGPLVPPRRGAGERGLLGLGIKVLDFFGIHVMNKPAAAIAAWLEDKRLSGHAPGVYRCPLDGPFALSPLGTKETLAAVPGPSLVFLHGTGSSTQGSFSELWDPKNASGAVLRARLKGVYGDRVYALEHRSLTESPIQNALQLVERLPEGAELHLVSHSRGGLIGELLCLSGVDALAESLSPTTLDALFNPDRIIARQLGLGPLGEQALADRKAAYDAERRRLSDLVGLLAARKIRVSRFVRVACPARGTTLASGRLDRWLSTLDFLAGRVLGDGLFIGGLDFVLAVVHERTDPRTLPGLEAMMPGSALTSLLAAPGLTTRADLTVIAGDIEGDSLLQNLKLMAVDWFYAADHDLVVNTGSMSGGLKRPPGGARYRLDRGSDVNHFAYFQNKKSVEWLLAGLTRADGADGGFLTIASAPAEAPRWRDALARSATVSAPRPLAVVLPGTMGSHLSVAGDHVWLNYGALLLGGLKKLRRDANGVTPTELIDQFYGPLLEFLARSHRVEYVAYDWRLSIREAAGRLADTLERCLPQAERDNQPVHLVAHSMGGLVVRCMIADGARGASLWQRITRLPGSRFLMLGTPNFGSYEAMRWLTGFNPTEAKLSLLDFTQSTDDIVNLVRRYPGLLELLPFGTQDPDFSTVAPWQSIKDKTLAAWDVPQSDDLRIAAATWQCLRNAAPDPRFMRYVAGSQAATVTDYQLLADDDLTNPRQHLDFIATRRGDGTVTWASGTLPGVPMWFVDDTPHDALCSATQAFPAYLEILASGTTNRLPSVADAVSRGDAPDERFPLPATPPEDGIPDESGLRGFGFGGGLPAETPNAAPAAPVIEVSIRHGDLSYARFPVLVGHYQGDPLVHAEATLDRQLDGALSRRVNLDIYPGRLDSHAVFFRENPRLKPTGALVIGLGQVGALTPGLLEQIATPALLDYALQAARWPDERFGPAGAPRSAAVSCLLVGSGAGGFPVRDSIDALLRAAVTVNRRLVDARLEGRITLDKLEFLELFEDVAIGAAEALNQILADGEFAAAVSWPQRCIEPGQGGRRRIRFGDAPGWWHRLDIARDGERLRFTFATDRARAEETLATGQLALADAFIRQASRSPRANPEAARTLFELLLPLRLREMAPQQGDMVLLVDEDSARFPWELLEDRWSHSGRPPAVQAGLLRQLKTATFRARPSLGSEARALVIGNPDLSGSTVFSDLPGARDEATRVAGLLGTRGFETEDCIDAKATSIVETLHKRPWRILHLAGHGVHRFMIAGDTPRPCSTCGQATPAPQKPISGMVIGDGIFLTPGDVEQLRWVPELVFINCCHLGNTTAPADDLDRAGLAANLGVEFIRMGVRAVIAAGWAVDDRAASTFAETFYGRMLAGESFGDAVRGAREQCWISHPGVNTWGAYQCYGDPAYRLRPAVATTETGHTPFFAPSELVAELSNLIGQLKAHVDPDSPRIIEAILQRIPAAQGASWRARADVSAALGLAWSEARCWPEAIAALEQAMQANSADLPVRAIEQWANLSARRAVECLHDRAPITAAQRKEMVATLRTVIDRLQSLRTFGATIERLSLLGSTWKRLALVQTGSARVAALGHMADAYGEAFALGKETDPYPFANAWTAELLQPDAPSRPERDTTCSRLLALQADANARNPSFWGDIAVADLKLARLLARCAGGGPAPRLPEACLELSQEVTEAYQAALARGASERERASVTEHIDFLIRLTAPKSPQLAFLQTLRNTLA